MRAPWRLLACVAFVVLVHVGLAAAWLSSSASGVRRLPPHRMAAVRMIVLQSVTEPQATSPAPRGPAGHGAQPPASELTRAVGPLDVRVPQTVDGHSAQSPERPVPSPPSPPSPTLEPVRDFLSPAEVDRVAIAFPSPDVDVLQGLSWSGVPMRLRLFIAANGQCVDMQALSASEDADTLDHVRRMFLATRFIPARRAGVDVDSYRDIELDVSDVR